MTRLVPAPHAAFDASLAVRTDLIGCRPRTVEDDAFLIACTIASSPLTGVLPEAMLAQQAAFQRAAHDGAHPDAMHRIVLIDGQPIGHMLVGWSATGTHLVDIALLPEHRAKGFGNDLLRAWLDVADAANLLATLEVQTANPARRLYARLGFSETNPAPWEPVIDMRRPPVQR